MRSTFFLRIKSYTVSAFVLLLLTITHEAGGQTTVHVAVFNNSEIRFVNLGTASTNRGSADNACKNNNSELIDVKTLEIQNFLTAEIPNTTLYVSGSSGAPWDRGFITGGYKRTTGGSWAWMDGTLLPSTRNSGSFSNWLTGSPNRADGNVVLQLSAVRQWNGGGQTGEVGSTATGAWFERTFGAPNQRAYICQSFCLPDTCRDRGNCTHTFTGFQCQYDCPALPSIENGTVTTLSDPPYIPPANITYTCNAGFSFSANATTSSVCSNGQWIPEKPVCFRDCADLPVLGNGTVTASNGPPYASAFPATNITYTCNDGFTANDGPTSAICSAGQWFPQTILVCFKDCDNLPVIENGNVTSSNEPPYTSLLPATNITYTCNAGYSFASNATTSAVCAAGEWSPRSIPVCFKDCTLPLLENGNVTTSNDSPYVSAFPATNITYTCNDGYRFSVDATTTAICSTSGQWLPVTPVCFKDCPNLPTHMFGNVTASDPAPYRSAAPATTVEYTCDATYYFDLTANTNSTCVEGNWFPVASACFQDCTLPSLLNGNVTASNDPPYMGSSTTITYTCNAGYSFPLDATTAASCLSGQWSPDPPPLCWEDCATLPLLEHGDVTASNAPPYVSAFPITNVTYTCNAGYRFSVNSTTSAICSAGQWLPETLPVCVKDCLLPLLEHGNITSSNGPPYVSTIPATNITYTCNAGYRLSTNATTSAICQSSGQWLPETIPVCFKDCLLPLLEHGNITSSNGPPYISTFPATNITYTCNADYRLSTNATNSAICQSSGQWLPETIPVCFKDCLLPLLEHGNITSSNGPPYVSTFPATSITYTCNTGYRFPTDATTSAICQSSGQWLPEIIPVCFKDCLLPLLEHGNVTSSNGPPYVSTFPATSITYTCNAGYSLSTDATTSAICLSSGQWFPETIPVCFKDCTLPLLDNGSATTSNGPPYVSTFSATNITYTCNAGYSFSVNATTSAICSAGQWLPEIIPVCFKDPTTTEVTSTVATAQLWFHKPETANLSLIEVEKIIEGLKDLKTNNQDMEFENEAVMNITSFFKDISQRAKDKNIEISEELFGSISTTTDAMITQFVDGPPTPGEPEMLEAMYDLVTSLQSFATTVTLNGTEMLTQTFPSFVVQVSEEIPESNSTTSAFLTTPSLPTFVQPQAMRQHKIELVFEPNGPGGIRLEIPYVASEMAHSMMENKIRGRTEVHLRSTFTYFESPELFAMANLDRDDIRIVSGVISGELCYDFVPLELRDLSVPVTITFPLKPRLAGRSAGARNEISEMTMKEIKAKRLECRYLSDNMTWSTEGCCLNISTENPICQCSHLTDFAMTERKVPDAVVLSYVTDVACIFSILCFLMTIQAYASNQRLISQTPVRILLSICGHLLVVTLLIAVGIVQSSNPTACWIFTGILHYFSLTTWFWIVGYVHHLNSCYVKNSFVGMKGVFFFANGMALFIVVLNVILSVAHFDNVPKSNPRLCGQDSDPFERTYMAVNMCWLTGYSHSIGFMLPTAIAWVSSIVVAMLLNHKLVASRKVHYATTSSPNMIFQQTLAGHFTMFLVIFTTTSAVWVFAHALLTYTNSDDVHVNFSKWTIAISLICQGLAVYIFGVVNKQEVWRESIVGRCCARTETSDGVEPVDIHYPSEKQKQYIE